MMETRNFVTAGPLIDVRVADQQRSGDGSVILEGYAAVFDQETRLWDGRSFVVTERIQRGAFADVLARMNSADPVARTLVHLNLGHNMDRVMAASDVTGVGGLLLEEDSRGLRFEARVDPRVTYISDAAIQMGHGVIRQASFAFTVDEQDIHLGETSDGRELEAVTLTKVRDLFDVCVCPQGAYPQTESFVRSVHATYLGRSPGEGEGRERRPGEGGAADVAPGVGVDDTAGRKLKAAKAKASARTTLTARS